MDVVLQCRLYFPGVLQSVKVMPPDVVYACVLDAVKLLMPARSCNICMPRTHGSQMCDGNNHF
jgi:hypothetical protein